MMYMSHRFKSKPLREKKDRKLQKLNGKESTSAQSKNENPPVHITHTRVFDKVAFLVNQLLILILGESVKITEVATIIVNAAVNCTTMNAAARRATKGIKAPAIRYHCRKLKGLGYLIERSSNKLLLEQARTILQTGKAYEFAIDTNEKETYQKQKNRYIIKSKAKNGTNKFIAHATLYAMVQGKRVTLAFSRVRKGLTRVQMVRKLLAILLKEGYQIRRLYLDRGLYSVEVIQLLKRKPLNAIVAMPLKGEKNGLKSKLHGRKSHWLPDYEAKTIIKKVPISVLHDVAAIAIYLKGRRGKKGVQWYVYAVIGEKPSLKRIREIYRGRFGIETSYRIKNQALGWTTSPMPELRTLYFAVSLLLQNEWVCVNWFYFREKKRGRPHGKPLFPFEDYLALLMEGCKQVLGRFTRVRPIEWREGGPLG
jgi:hypothetical protein